MSEEDHYDEENESVDEEDESMDEEDEDEESDEELLTHAEHKEQGNQSYKSKDYRGAMGHYTLAIETARNDLDHVSQEEASELRPLLASYYNNRAASFTMISKHAEGIEDCDAALELDPKNAKASIRKAKLQQSTGDLDGALHTYSLMLRFDANDAKAIQERVSIQTLQKRVQLVNELLEKTRGLPLTPNREGRQALAQIELVLAACPSWSDALTLKVEALLNNKSRTSEAYALTTKLMRESSNQQQTTKYQWLLLLRATCLFNMAQLDDCLKHIRQVMVGDPDHKVAFKMLKFVRSLTKKKEEADKAYKERRYPDAVESYTQALELCNTTGESSPTLTGAPRYDVSNYKAKLFFNRASTNANLRNHKEVVEDCTEALTLDDEYTKALLRRATSLLLMGEEPDCAKAIRDFERALELLPDVSEADEAKIRDTKKKLQQAQVQHKQSKQKDFYKLLGVARDATDGEVKKGYRKLALKWHPDRHASSTEEEKAKAEHTFRDINLAYEVLSDPVKKQRYDNGVDEQDLDNPHADHHHHGGHGGMGGGGIDPDVLFQMFMQQQGGGGGRRGGGGGFHFG